MASESPLSFKEAKLKAASFCAYQERTQQEVRKKLYDLGIYGDNAEEIIALLITENFINEERFAKAYAGGKFRMNHWGRIKIRIGLQTKGISPKCMETGLTIIDEEEYLQKIDYLIQKKRSHIKEQEELIVKGKIANYLISKGFEPPVVWERIDFNFTN